MKIGFTGTRNGMTEAQKQQLYKLLSQYSGEFHHGDCVGADTQAHEIAKELGFKLILHPSTAITRAWNTGDYENVPAPPLVRNKHIVNETQFMFATPKEEGVVSFGGTWHAIRYAARQHRNVFIIWPNGTYIQTKENNPSFLEMVASN